MFYSNDSNKTNDENTVGDYVLKDEFICDGTNSVNNPILSDITIQERKFLDNVKESMSREEDYQQELQCK